jgi:hypothetical protein
VELEFSCHLFLVSSGQRLCAKAFVAKPWPSSFPVPPNGRAAQVGRGGGAGAVRGAVAVAGNGNGNKQQRGTGNRPRRLDAGWPPCRRQ